MAAGSAGLAREGCLATGPAIGSGELQVVVNFTLGKTGVFLEHKLKV